MSATTIAYVTSGGAGMFCGSCMRDNTLAAALRSLGCDIVLIPTFTPIRTDEEDVSADRVFLGGINIYLEQRWPFLRRLPRFARRGLDHPRLLSLLSSLALQRRKRQDGEVALSLLRGEHGCHRREMEDLVGWLAHDCRPDIVNLTNLLIAGFVPALKARVDIPVFVTLQGDDVFLDGLGRADRGAVLGEMRKVARYVDGFLVFSRYYRDHMARMLEIPHDRFHLVPMGLATPQAFAPVAGRPVNRPLTIGFLARICHEKGFHVLVDAFMKLRRQRGTEQVRLRAAGWLSGGDRPFFRAQRRKLAAAGLVGAFDHVKIPDRRAKIRFLHSLDVLSVPSIYREPKGIYVLEALAAGVPVVVPGHGALPELLAASGGGRLVPPEDPTSLATTLRDLLLHPTERRRLGEEGRDRVCRTLHAEAMARRTLEVWGQAPWKRL